LNQPGTNPEDAFAWHLARRRQDAPEGLPVRGFGPGGSFTLWLPNPELTQKMEFKDGRAVVSTVAPASDPALLDKRKHALLTLRTEAGILYGTTAVLDYAALLIQRSYNVTDDDLNMLLLSGNKWHQGIILNMIGGEDMRDIINNFMSLKPNPAFLDSYIPTAVPELEPEPEQPQRPRKKRHARRRNEAKR
jgi:hypothetical protein